MSEEIFYFDLIISRITLTYLASVFGRANWHLLFRYKRSMGCQGFIGRIPSTFPDKFSLSADEEFLKNEMQM